MLGAWTPLHTALETSDPPEDAVLTAAPARITLTYTTDVQLDLSRVELARAEASTVELGTLRYLSAERHDVLVAAVPPGLTPGTYRVEWTTAGPDGHAINGAFAFTVEGPPEAAAQEPPDDSVAEEPPSRADSASQAAASGADETSDPVQSRMATGARWLFYLGIVAILGATAFRFLVLSQLTRGGELEEVVRGATTTLWRIAGAGAVAFLLAAPFRLWFQYRSFYGEGEAPLSGLAAVATSGAWGRGWLLNVGLGLLVGAGVLLARPRGERRPGWAIIAIGALILPIVPVMSGHAWGRSPQVLAVASDFIHVVAAGTWVGGLFCLLFAGLPALRVHGVKEGSGQPGLPGMVAAYSRVALASVALLALSGILNAWLHLESFAQLWSTSWGRALLVKLAIVGAVMGLGFYNWRFVRPALAETPRPGLLKGPATLELILGIVALIATSFLVVQPLAGP